MEKAEHRSFKDDLFLDGIIILIALWLLFGAAYLFANEVLFLSWLGTTGNYTVIGRVDHTNEDVRRRVYDDFTWYPTTSRDQVYNNDSIFTDQGSTADISFKNKSKVGIAPNSLVLLRLDKQGQPMVVLSRGAVAVKASKGHPVVLMVDDKKRVVEADQKVVVIESEKNPSQPKNRVIAAVKAPDEPKKQKEPPMKFPFPDDGIWHSRSVASKEDEIVVSVADEIGQFKDFYPFEFSARASYLFSKGSGLLMGEAQFMAWAKNIFGSMNKRWGMDAFFGRSVPGGKDSNGSPIELTRLKSNLKFNLIPGTWNREMVGGISASGQWVAYQNVGVMQVGPGLYWGRMLSGTFDDSSGSVPWWKYPKWIDAELQYYITTPTPNYHLNTNYSAALSSKLFVSRTVFVMGSVGYFNYDYTDNNRRLQVKVNSVFGTCGVGFDF